MSDNPAFDSISKVLNIVNHAVSTGDYTSMSRQIGDLIGAPQAKDLYESVKEKYAGNKYRGGHMQGTPTVSPSGQNRTQNRTVQNQAPAVNLYFRGPSPYVGKILLGVGIAGLILLLIPTIIGLYGVASGNFIARMIATIPLVFAGGFGVLAVWGGISGAKSDRFRRYCAVIGVKMYADVRDLASAVGRPEKFVVKDLKKMTLQGWFRQGHLDGMQKTFMATDALYQQSLETERRVTEQKKNASAVQAADAAIPEDVRQILEKGNAYINQIQQANDAIADAGVSEKLDRMKSIVEKIFAQVRKQPSLAKNLNMFMDYYLPTTGKLIDAYKEMDAQPIQGENIRSAKHEIEGSLDTINDAFENLLDSFFKDRAMDVSTDISVMKTMMKQEGLTPDDLTQMKQKQEAQAMEHGPTLEELNRQIKEKVN